MGKKWYSVWENDIPKFFEPEKSLPQYLKDSVISAPDKVALSFYGYDMTYDELREAVDKFAGGLKALGVKKGDRVALYMESCPQFVISYFGILQAGAIAVSLNPMFKHAELEYELNDSGAETLVALDFLYPEIAKLGNRKKLKNILLTSLTDYLPKHPTLPLTSEMKRPKSNFSEAIDFSDFLKKSPSRPGVEITDLKKDVAVLQYTGGTTGLPKGAVITHNALGQSAFNAALWFRYTPEDVHLGAAPFFHSYGMAICLSGALVSGGGVVILSRVSPEMVAKAIAQYGCTVWITTATLMTAMLEWPDIDKYALNSLRMVLCGAAPVAGALMTRLNRVMPQARIIGGYGLTETMAGGGAVCPLSRSKPGFIGIPNISTEIKIVDLETRTREVEALEEGEVVIKCGSMMAGYWNKPEETKKVLRDGWLYTGDIGKMDGEGWVAVVGRKKELIKCSGYSVFPTEVEDLLYKHPAVAEAAVIGVQDPYRGESPKAFIVLRSDHKSKINETDIIDWARENMAAYKRPRMVEFREELPKSGAGKILRRVLADEEAHR
jgi:acyl-CoA synthetase (AMP-forming)/AMP-acid ligase II